MADLPHARIAASQVRILERGRKQNLAEHDRFESHMLPTNALGRL
jgi:hypothetical protein